MNGSVAVKMATWCSRASDTSVSPNLKKRPPRVPSSAAPAVNKSVVVVLAAGVLGDFCDVSLRRSASPL